MTVLERVLVLDRRVRLTPLAMLELLATERIEGGRWTSRSAMTGNGEDIPLTTRAWNCKIIYLIQLLGLNLLIVIPPRCLLTPAMFGQLFSCK